MEIHQGFTCSPWFPCKPFSGNRGVWEAGALQRFVQTLSIRRDLSCQHRSPESLGMTKDSQRPHLHPFSQRTSPAIWCLHIQWPSCQSRRRDNLVSSSWLSPVPEHSTQASSCRKMGRDFCLPQTPTPFFHSAAVTGH